MRLKGRVVEFRSPEMTLGKYNELTDVWSIGVILYNMLTGKAPFTGQTDAEITQNIRMGQAELKGKRWKKWESLSIEVKDLIGLMLEKDPEQRIYAKDAILHPWI